MPSNGAVAVALTLMVLVSGCSMLPGGGGAQTTTTTYDAPEHHEFVFGSYSSGAPFTANVTIATDGEVVHTQTVRGDGTGTYVELGTFDEAGPYTVTVNTTLPAAGNGTMDETFTVDGSLGSATAVRVAYTGIYHSHFPLPRRHLDHPAGVKTWALDDHKNLPMDVQLEVAYRGEHVANSATTFGNYEGNTLVRSSPLNRTGFYVVTVHAPEETVAKPVVVTYPDHHVRVIVDGQGYVERIEVRPAYKWMDNPRRAN